MNKRLTAILIAGSVLLLAGASYVGWLYLGRTTGDGPALGNQETNDRLEPAVLEAPDLDLSLSGLQAIEAPELTAVPEMGLDLGSSTDLAIATSLAAELDLTVATPTIAVGLTADDIEIDAAGLSASAGKQPSADGNAVPSSDNASTSLTIDCAQFAAVPSCSYVTGPARALCEQCK